MDEPLAFGVSHGVSDLAVNVADHAGGQGPVGLGLRRAKRASGTARRGAPGGSRPAAVGTAACDAFGPDLRGFRDRNQA